jgi:hypothetical protein
VYSHIANIPDRFELTQDRECYKLNSDVTAMASQINGDGKSHCTFKGANRPTDVKEKIDNMMVSLMITEDSGLFMIEIGNPGNTRVVSATASWTAATYSRN